MHALATNRPDVAKAGPWTTGPWTRGAARTPFYACRDEQGQLEGVALIGHYILFEARTDAAIERFAHLAQECRSAHMVLAEQDKVETFWSYYADGGQAPRLFCRELLLEQRWPIEIRETVPGLRVATLSSSADSVTLCAMLVLVVGFDIFLDVDIADYAMLATIGLALIVWLFYRSRRELWNKTT